MYWFGRVFVTSIICELLKSPILAVGDTPPDAIELGRMAAVYIKSSFTEFCIKYNIRHSWAPAAH